MIKKIKHYLKQGRVFNKLIKRGLVVGQNFDMMDDVIIDSSHCWHIFIGDNVTLAPRVHILAHDAAIKKFLGYTKIGNVKIGNDVFVGAGTIILPGVQIGNNVIIGAGSIVAKDIPDNTVTAGNPLRVICTFNDFVEKIKLEMNRYPLFGEEFTLRGGITEIKRNEMINKMKDRYGFVV